MSLRRDLAKLAHDKPETRADILPLLRRTAFNKENPVELLSQLAKVVDKRGFKALSKAIKKSDLMKSIQQAVDNRSGVAEMNEDEKAVWVGRLGSEE